MVTPCDKCGGQRVVHYGFHCMECSKPEPKDKQVFDMILCLEYVKHHEMKRKAEDVAYYSPFHFDEDESILEVLDEQEFNNDSFHDGLSSLLWETGKKYDRFLEYFPGTEEALFELSW